jgi:intracellular sulfur oxidation DsrE/DsrF family protein
VLQISDNDPHKMMGVLNVAANVSRHYSGIGEEVEIRIVAFEGGLHLLRTDTAPEDVAKRVQGFGMSMPNVTFLACGNTIDTMERLEGKKIPILKDAEIVQTGVVALIEANEAGWTIVRP